MAVITPYALARFSHNFFKMTTEHITESDSFLPHLYLYCVSIELGLKAAILAEDCTEKSKGYIKELGHDLLKVRDRFEEIYGTDWLNTENITVLKQINPYFKSKGLEYFTIEVLGIALKGFKQLPKVEQLQACAEKINNFLEQNNYFINGKTSQSTKGGLINFV